MKRFSFFALVIALGLAMVFHRNQQPNFPSANDSVNQATDGAFRDGLYLGKLTAERGAESHVAVARWATAEDRASFKAGYHRGYNEVLASRMVPAKAARRAE